MNAIGFMALRFSDKEVFENLNEVIDKDIRKYVISPNPSLEKRGIGFHHFPSHSISASPSHRVNASLRIWTGCNTFRPVR